MVQVEGLARTGPAMVTRYYLTATATDGRRFKLSNGRIVREEARQEEDGHVSRFAAITASVAALRAWQFLPAGLKVDIEERELC